MTEAEEVEAELARRTGSQTTGSGLAKTAVSALRDIPEGLAKGGSALVQWERRKAAELAKYMGADQATVDAIANFGGPQWSPEQIEAGSDIGVNAVLPQSAEAGVKEWTQHQPQNQTEEDVAAVSQFLPALLTKNPQGLSRGPAVIRKLVTRVLAPAAAVEKSGQATHAVAPEYENAVRFLVGAVSSPGAWKSAAARAAARQVTTSPGALNDLRRAVIADYGNTPEGLQRAQQALQEMGIAEGATLMDIGPNLKQAGQQIYSKPGAGREAIQTKLGEREAATDTRTNALIRREVGPRVDEQQELEALIQRKQEGGRRQEEAHPQQQQPVDAQSVIDDIDSRLGVEKDPGMRRHLQEIRESLHIRDQQGTVQGQLDPSSQGLLSARRAIRNKLYTPDGRLRENLGVEEAGLLQDYYGRINALMDEANPALRAADAEIAAAGKQEEAFRTGKSDVLKTDPDTAIAPEAFARTWEAMDPADKRFLYKGLTAKIDAMIGTTANDRAALKRVILGQGKWNHQKIAQIIGQERADALVRGLEREKVFQETTKDVLYNSKTAQTQTFDKQPAAIEIAKDAVERGAAGGALAGTTGAAIGAATAPIKNILNRAGDWMTAGKRAEMGRLLASGRPDDIVQAIQMLQAAPGGPSKMLLMALMARREQQRQEEEGQ